MNEDLILLRAASRVSLITFVERALLHLIPDYVHFPYIELIAANIERITEPKKGGRLVINLPPRHAKSWILVITAAWYLGNYPEKEVLLMAHSQSLAKDLAGKVAHLVISPFFQEIFPNFQMQEGRESMTDFRTRENGAFRAGGFETGITGYGANLLLIDDSLSAHDASSPLALARVRDTFDNMLATRMNDPKTVAVVSMSHRLHVNDLSGHLVGLGYDHLKLSFQATEDETFTCRGVEFRRKSGDVLQPVRWSVDDIQKWGVAPHVYATQYQQAPTPAGSGILQERYFPLVPTCPAGGETIISWDLASSTGERASYSVALVFQVKSDAAYLKHIFRDRLDYSRLKEQSLRLHSHFKPTRHLIESASLGLSLAADLRAAGVNVIDIKVGAASKEERLNAVLNKIVANYVRPVAGIANLKEFLDECTAFPNGTHDDMVDALTQFLNWQNENPVKPKHTPTVLLAGQRNRTSPRDARTALGRNNHRR